MKKNPPPVTESEAHAAADRVAARHAGEDSRLAELLADMAAQDTEPEEDCPLASIPDTRG